MTAARLIFAVALSAGALSQAAPAEAAAPCNRILFSAPGKGERTALFHARPDGSHRIRLTRDRSAQTFADYEWSPDGRRIAYLVGEGRTVSLKVMHRDGSHKRTLAREMSYYFDWAPGSERLVYTTVDETTGATTMHVVAVATGRSRPLAAGRRPDWSPEGDLIAFSTTSSDPLDRTRDIFVVRPDGSGLRALTTDPDSDDDGPAWSPDGSAVAFERYPLGQTNDPESQGPNADIWRIGHDGSALTQLTHFQNDFWGAFIARWSPTGCPHRVRAMVE